MATGIFFFHLAETRHTFLPLVTHYMDPGNMWHLFDERAAAAVRPLQRREVYLCRRENHLLISDVETAGNAAPPPPHPPPPYPRPPSITRCTAWHTDSLGSHLQSAIAPRRTRVLMNAQVFSFRAACGDDWGGVKKVQLRFLPSRC